MKKAIVLAVCLLLVGLLAVNGTLAQGISNLFADLGTFFAGKTSGAPEQDTEGELDVRLVYQKRNAAGTALVGEGTPEQLAPARYQAGFDWDQDKQNVGGVMLWDESKIGGAVDKFTSVKNAGEKSAYIRTAFALDKYAYDHGIIHLNFNQDDENFRYEGWKSITIKGRPYMMMVVTCKKELAHNATTPPMLLQVAMSNHVTNADLSNVSADFLLIKTMAIESDVFVEKVDGVEQKMSAEAALNLALPLDSLQPFQ